MPAVSEKQRSFMGAEYGKAKAGKKTKTGMAKQKLRDFASKPVTGGMMVGMGKGAK